MATFSSNRRSDHIFHSATLRNLPTEFVANSHWDYVSQNDRLKRFLLRNMTRVKASHRKRCASAAHSAKPSRSQPASSKPTNGHLDVNGNGPNGIPYMNGVAKSVPPNRVDQVTSEHNTSISAIDAMSAETLLVKHKSDTYDANKRKSLRNVFQKQHEDPNASLIINLRNIRKRLNWKDNGTVQDLPPRKRARLAPIPCDLYLAIWDNSDSSANKIPVVSKREFCELTKARRDADPVKGDFVELKLDEPLIITHKELRVPVRNGRERMALAKEYFMEIKILPRDDHVVWPPIPMLGKSDGDRFNGMAINPTEDTTPFMIARYQHLPNAPDAETPLAIFVYAEGTTFRTKYGLEVDAKWVKRDHPDLVRKPSPEPQLESWALDTDRKPFGRVDPTQKPVSYAARKSVPVPKRPTPKVVKEPEITYNVPVPKSAKKEFSKFSVSGFKCYICSVNPFDTFEDLRFHLDQTHKNIFTLEKETIDPADAKLSSATIRVESPSNQRLKVRHGHPGEETDGESIYVAPSVPFDLHAHYKGKASPWSKVLPTQAAKEAIKAPQPEVRIDDTQSLLRHENGGHVPYRQVLPFRPQKYRRKKYSNKKLLTKHFSLQNPYTSVSHRPVCFDHEEEDARSETDDEVDDTWFVNRHLEELDMHTWQEDWPEARRRLAKKWDWHMLHRERGVGARFLGDCLVRFIRMEKKWILREKLQKDDPDAFLQAQSESIGALMDMMEELKDIKAINDNVCTDVMTMLYDDDQLQIPVEEEEELLNQEEEMVKRGRDIYQHKESISGRTSTKEAGSTIVTKLPSNVCVECRLPIGHENQRAVRCSSLGCLSPNVWYHAKCAGLSMVQTESPEGFEATQAMVLHNLMKARLSWKCRRCEGMQGKGKMIPPVPMMARIDTPVKQEDDHVMVDASAPGNETSENMTDDTDSRSKSSSVVPAALSHMQRSSLFGDVQGALSSQRIQYTAYVDDRRSLRGIVLHHYHDQGECIYAVIDERPTRSRSKKPHTVLATIQEDNSKAELSGQRYFVHFPDAIKKRDSERWWFVNRSIEAEIIARFRPYKIQHYVRASQCRAEPCTCIINDPTQLESGCLQLETKRINDCKYARNTLMKEPGRGFYVNEQDNPGTVWYGDYFDELQKAMDTERRMICRDASHLRCTHSVTAKGTRYKGFGKVDREPWQ